MERTLPILLLLALLQLTWGLIAYDCGGTGLNVTTVSLLDIGECDIETRRTNDSEVYIQLLQLSNFDHTRVIHCKIEITRVIFYCGMHSHSSAVTNGYNEYLHDTSYHMCKRLHEDGTLNLGSHLYLTGFQVNGTSSRPVTFAGSLTTSGECEGTSYSDPYGTWNKVVVQGTVRVTLRTSIARIKSSSGKIIMASGTVCNVQDGHCIDDENGHSFWRHAPVPACDFGQYDLLYEGTATRVSDALDTVSPTLFTLTTKDVTFALAKTGETYLCGYTLFRTEHPKLFIMETTAGRGLVKQNHISVDNLDIFAYVNSKFIYVERHIRNQVSSLYHDVLLQRCRLERQVLTNALSLAKTSPEDFAYALMKGPGYISVIAGEVAHVLRCVPVNVKVRPVTTCYNELPVLKGNLSMFIAPRTRILIRHGTERDCNNFLPIMYNIDGAWHRFIPHAVESLSPQTLQPLTSPTWKYLIPDSLATSGIYSESDIERLRDHIMFPAEKSALFNNIARGAKGQTFSQEGFTMYNLFDEETLNKIAESTTAKVWEGFISFGSASAGILAIFIIIRGVKLLFDTVIRGYALHSIYGCSLHLLGAIWSSIATLLMHLGKQDKTATKDPEDPQKKCQRSEISPPISIIVSEQPHAPPLPAAPPATMPRTYRYTAPPPPVPRDRPCTHYSYEELRDRISRIDQNLPNFQSR